jgi:hypothetical protein
LEGGASTVTEDNAFGRRPSRQLARGGFAGRREGYPSLVENGE